ncbi:MAG: hypothetical protein WBM96_17720 [Polyangiales bacterium]
MPTLTPGSPAMDIAWTYKQALPSAVQRRRAAMPLGMARPAFLSLWWPTLGGRGRKRNGACLAVRAALRPFWIGCPPDHPLAARIPKAIFISSIEDFQRAAASLLSNQGG